MGVARVYVCGIEIVNREILIYHLQFIELVACGNRLLRIILCKFLEVNGLLNIGISLSCAP